MTDAELKAELTTDPAAMGYAGKSAQQIVNLLNGPKPGVTFPAIVPKATLLKIMGLGPFRAAALNDPKKTGWLQSLANIRSLDQGLIPSEPGVAELLAQAVADGVVTASEKAMIDAQGTRPGSRAEELWGEGTVLSLNTVARIL